MSQQDPIIFIGGCPRSGTTPLSLFLNSCADIFISNEEDLLHKVRHLEHMLSTRQNREQKAAGLPMREKSERENWDMSDVRYYQFDKSHLYDVLRHIYQLHYDATGKDGKMKIFGDKTPKHFQNIDGIMNLDIPAKYIHITRNPLDVINSMLRRTAMTKQGKDWWQAITKPKDMIKEWETAFNNIIKAQQQYGQDKILHIEYEEMVFETGKFITKISDFLGSDFLGVELNSGFKFIDEQDKHFTREYIDKKLRKQMDKTIIPLYEKHLNKV